MNNVNEPLKFQHKLDEVMDAIYELMELTKEQDLPAVDEEGVSCFDEEDGKTGFQVAGQFNRPAELLQSLIDIIRVQYEPSPLGTFFLNSNIGFILDAVPEYPFQLGYLSITSNNNKSFNQFWDEDVLTHIEHCGYALNVASAVFVVASTWQRYGYDFSSEVSEKLDSGFSLPEGRSLLSAFINENIKGPSKHIYAGFCPDEALDNKIRLSLWLFVEKAVTKHH